ncbi:MAG: pumilio domain member 6 [Claussenomyces sp. TS43310]|nr:MAG: pumilio domain member 6 [Claussenomyces sp. TS43310]
MATAATKMSKIGTKRKAEIWKGNQKKKPKVDSKKIHPKVPTAAEAATSEESSDSSVDYRKDNDGSQSEDGAASTDSGDSVQISQVGIHSDRVNAVIDGNGRSGMLSFVGRELSYVMESKSQLGTSSKEAHAKQKQLVLERKSSKPLAEQLARTKKIWERLRRKSHVPLDERKMLVTELFGVVTGRIRDFVLKHDAVRVIQTAIKYSNLEQKRMIARELQGTYRHLAESRYAKFLIGKLLVQGDNEIRDIIVPEFFGHVRRLIKHPEASWILDDVYRGVASRQQRATMLREWYGAEFALFKQEDNISGDLKDLLAEESSKRAPIMRSLRELINHLVQKKMTGFTILHDAMLQYILNARPGTEEVTEFIELLKGDEEGDLIKNLAFTSSGSRVICRALAYGSAKDRKHILKAYKDTLQLMAADPHGHVIILASYELIDDTVLTARSIFPELLGKDLEKQIANVIFMANNLHARTTLLYLFSGRSSSLFPAGLVSDLETLKDIDSIRVTTSKKDPEVRRQELAKALSPLVLTSIASAPTELVTTSFGCRFVTEILFGADGDKSAALAAIASTAAGDPSTVTTEEKPKLVDQDVTNTREITVPHVHIAQTPFGGKMLRALVAGGCFDSNYKKIVPVVPALNFADKLYPVIKDHIVAWATGPSSFVVLSLAEAADFELKAEMLQALKMAKKTLQRAADEETEEQKAKTLELAMAAKNGVTKVDGKRKKRQRTGMEPEVGNKGSNLLLQYLM